MTYDNSTQYTFTADDIQHFVTTYYIQQNSF